MKPFAKHSMERPRRDSIRAREGIRQLVVMALALSALTLLPLPASADWPALGRALCTQDSTQGFSVITRDGAGGAIVVWLDGRSPHTNIFASRVTMAGDVSPGWPANGTSLLADEVALANAFGGQESPRVVADGEGG